MFELELGSRKETVSVDRLKLCLSSEVTPVAPPHHGQLPLQPAESQPPASILGGPCSGQKILQHQEKSSNCNREFFDQSVLILVLEYTYIIQLRS